MSACGVQQSGSVALLFYGELGDAERADVKDHLARCTECRRAFEELTVIQAALAGRPDVSAPAGGEWTGFMARLADVLANEPARPAAVVAFERRSGRSAIHRYVGYLAMAALLVLVTLSVAYIAISRRIDSGAHAGLSVPAVDGSGAVPSWSVDAAFASLSEQHFERSKLVVLGLANKDSQLPQDWAYERQLAAALLSDTRLYRQAAEERGFTQLARVLDDLELVLLQTSIVEQPEPGTLEQIQRLIRKRDLVTKMNVVTTVAGL